MIKVQLKYLLNSMEALKGILAFPLNSKAHYDLSKVSKKIRDEVEAFQDAYNSKVEEYGKEEIIPATETEEAKPTGKFKLLDENLKVFNDEIKKLTEEEIEININPISFNALGIKDGDDKNDKTEKYANLGNHLSFLTWLIID